MRHYFLTYKAYDPGTPQVEVEIKEVYGAERARKVISAAMLDYDEAFGE